jgi:subtilisin family serine protease
VRRAALSLAAAALAAGASAPAAQAGRVLVAAPDARALPGRPHLVATLQPGVRAYSLQTPRGMSAERYAARLRTRAEVLAAQPNERFRLQQIGGFCALAPTQPDTSVAVATNANAVSVPTTAPIAVLDTGVDANVPELAGKIVSPFNALDGSANVTDTDGHGTEVGAMAAGSPGLFLGLSPTSRIMPIKIFGVGGDTSAQILIKAIQQAVAAKAGVINISGANPLSAVDPADSSVVQMAIESAYASGVLTVAAAGNEGKWQPDVPESYPHVLSVGSVDGSLTRSTFTNSGPWLDLMSVGQGLTLPEPASVCGSGYGVANGTSFAAPAVAAAVAILRQLHPAWTPEQITAVLRATAKDISPPGFDDDSGYGLLNVGAAATATPPAVDATELDDDIQWVSGRYASRHPSYLRTTRKARIVGSVSPAKDPQDVYPVQLKKGERLTVDINAANADSLLDSSIFDPLAGPMDVTNDVGKHKVADYLGVSNSPGETIRATRTGRYYVTVEAADVPDAPADPGQPPPTVPSAERYTLVLSKTPAPKPRHKKTRKRKQTKKR